MKKVKLEQGVCRGFRCDRPGPVISHLFFIDDSLLYIGASAKDCQAIRNILGVYSRASGQQVNFEKSSMCVSKGVSSSMGDKLVRLIGVQRVRCLDRYLGIPDFASKNKKQLHKDIKEHVWNRIRGWQGKLLSIEGREVLIKAVIQSIPTYSMSLFRLPRNLLNELHGLCNHFRWGSKVTKKSIYWVAWDKLCRGKDMGGMGVRNLINFNKALLVKHVWLLIKNPGSLTARVLIHLYFRSCYVLEIDISRKGSYFWHNLCWGRSLIDAGSRWRIGCGSGVSIYNDKWIPRPNSLWVVSLIVRDDIVFVSQLKTESSDWNVPLIRHLFLEVDAFAILSIPTFASQAIDTLCGTAQLMDSNRASSSGSGLLESWWRTLWHLEIPSKVKVFIWRACRHWISTRQCLTARHIPIEVVCPICLRESKTVIDALWGWKRLKTIREACVFMEKTSFAKGCKWVCSDKVVSAGSVISPGSVISNVYVVAKWTPPLGDLFKINTDAALDVEDNIVGMGAVIRNRHGEVMGLVVQR
ncbi:hypothetical protein Ddye_013429 [Dipteronia dyeriana]|uniref:Reverse transcriptase zinc-binding domain-containing protein n=1 Tax=Dipteronia dyeriana TaxID=168575 RepID=A0AAD9X6J9_9ROSI|nr:hypothetical protein Ddye_013429 [Dipteronia dyeriana]